MGRKHAPKPMSPEARKKVAAAKKAWWAAKKAEGYVQPTRGKPRSAETKAKVSASLKQHFQANPDAAKKSATHREAIRRGKLAYEQAFEEVKCVGAGCPNLTRHHQSLCKEHIKLRTRARIYQTTVTAITQAYEDQDGKCAICPKDLVLTGHPPKTNTRIRAVIDHDHKTKSFRGLLCNNCNTSIGLAEDNVETLQKAIDYLTRIRDE